MKVLVIDSNKDLEVIYRRKLTKLTKEVEYATTEQKVKKLLLNNQYDLVLVSHTMKNTDGKKIYKCIRDSKYTGPVVVTASGRDIEKLRSEYNGICGLINKCLSSKIFVEKLVSLKDSELKCCDKIVQ